MATEEKTQQATPRRRQKAREEGQVAQSKELGGALSLGASLLVLRMAGQGIGERVQSAAEQHYAHLNSFSFSTDALAHQLAHWLGIIGSAVMPMAIAALVLGAVTSVLQTGFMFSTKSMTPKAEKLNPLSGLKRIFSLNGVVEAAKGVLKVVIVGMLVWGILSKHREEVLSFQQMELSQALQLLYNVLCEFGTKYCLALLAIGGADYGYQRWQHEKQMRMSHDEVKREMKESEGDPLMRSRRRQRARALLKQGISSELPAANVVVVNPTHVAVALMYKDGLTPAPKIVAKGRGSLAARIKELACTYGIPIVEEPPVARALFDAVEIGDYVPPMMYEAVAEILARVYRAAAQKRMERHAKMQARNSSELSRN